MTDDELIERLNVAVGGVLFNASNYPRTVLPHMLGQDTGPLRAKVLDAVLAVFREHVKGSAKLPQNSERTQHSDDERAELIRQARAEGWDKGRKDERGRAYRQEDADAAGQGHIVPDLKNPFRRGAPAGPRPAGCCGKCPPIVGGGYDCTCEGNPRCSGAPAEPAANVSDPAKTDIVPDGMSVTDEMVKAAARELAIIDLPDNHTLDDRLTVNWMRWMYQARAALEAALSTERGESRE